MRMWFRNQSVSCILPRIFGQSSVISINNIVAHKNIGKYRMISSTSFNLKKKTNSNREYTKTTPYSICLYTLYFHFLLSPLLTAAWSTDIHGYIWKQRDGGRDDNGRRAFFPRAHTSPRNITEGEMHPFFFCVAADDEKNYIYARVFRV